MRIASRDPELINWNALPLLLGEKETANILGVSLSYLRKSRCEGTRRGRTPAPPYVRVDGRCYYRLTDLQEWVDGLSTRNHV
jgi:hypothetical protein